MNYVFFGDDSLWLSELNKILIFDRNEAHPGNIASNAKDLASLALNKVKHAVGHLSPVADNPSQMLREAQEDASKAIKKADNALSKSNHTFVVSEANEAKKIAMRVFIYSLHRDKIPEEGMYTDEKNKKIAPQERMRPVQQLDQKKQSGILPLIIGGTILFLLTR